MAGIDLSRLNAGQRAVVERLDEPLFVAAGAGSGKTFTLTARLVHALSEGSAAGGGRYLSSIDEALVITFTEAAALEIKERVRQALREAGEDDPVLREESLKVDGAWISTIHGMCARILHRYALELGIDPEFSVCEGSIAEALKAQALDEIMSEVQQDDEYEALRSEYRLWTKSDSSVVGMIEVLRTEASKCLNGYDDFVCPQSHEAAGEVLALWRMFESFLSLDITARQREMTEASLVSLTAFANLSPGEQTAARACEALAGVKVPALSKKDQKALKEEAKLQLAQAKACAQYERVQELCPQLIGLARRVDERFAQLKHEHSYLDNNDLISMALKAVQSSPAVAQAYAGRFRLVMIDEFQDTDARQLNLISLLAGSDAQHLTTVGDAQQSIYRFRGGDVEVFKARGQQLPPEHHVAMDVNYRSDHNVLALVERVCGDAALLGDFLKLAGDAHRKSSYVARSEDGSEPCRIHLEVAAGGNAELMSATLAAQLADRLAAYRDAGQPVGSMALLLGTTGKVGLYLDALRARGLPAVVTGGSSFTSTPEVGVMQALLHTLANPHDTETGLFRLLSSDMFRLDADDFCQLGTRRQEVLDAPTKRPVEQCFVTGQLELFGDVQPSARLLRAHTVLSRAFARMGRWRLADVCQAVLEESGWLARLEGQDLSGMATAANLLAAVRYIRELTEGLGLGVARAADEFDRWLEAAKLTPANLVGDTVDAVKVMTIHGSKGLQFAVTAVAECWGNPSVSGRLSVARIDGKCVLCLAPGQAAGSPGSLRKELDTPLAAEQCRSVVEWSSYLDEVECNAEAAEKARLIYVALTRAEEALVVGVPLSDSEPRLSVLGAGTVGAFAELDQFAAEEAGELPLLVTPRQPIELEYRAADAAGAVHRERMPVEAAEGLARVVRLIRPPRGSGEPWQVDSAGTLAGFDGLLPDSVTLIPLLGTQAAEEDATARDEHFLLFDVEVADQKARPWRAREGVFSYSSAHAQMEEERKSGQDAPESPARPPAPPKAQQEADAEGSAYVDDQDKATNLGSAFHQLAQTMVETGCDHSQARLEALSRTWHLSPRQTMRLTQAIGRWERSDIRREAQSYELLRAEVPFFVRVDARYGQYVEGAIDLLACNRGATEALVVDYKTGDVGLTVAQIEERHRMQANFYAWVLMSQGFKSVTCAFVCVEVDDGAGGPVVVRYRFDEGQLPRID